MNADAELDAWRATWHDAAPVRAASPGAARAADLRYRALAVVEYGVGVLLLVGSLCYGLRAADATRWAWAATVWGLALPTLFVTARLRRGLWSSADASVRGFLELAIRRHRHALRATRYGYGLLVATAAVNAAWALATVRAAPAATGWMLLDTLLLAALFVVGLAHYARRTDRGLAALERLARDFDEPP
jgi:hypothetical protein